MTVTVFTASANAQTFSVGADSWGLNTSGQLGNGSTVDAGIEGAVNGLNNVQAVSAGSDFALALLKNGTVMAWGDDSMGQLGPNGPAGSYSSVPVVVGGLSSSSQLRGPSTVKTVVAGSDFALALFNDGDVLAWGDDSVGQLGANGPLGSHTDVPVEVTGLPKGVYDVDAGGNFSLAISPYGSVKAWGGNSEGQLGDGSTTNSSTPVAVKGLRNNTQGVQAGDDFALAVLGPNSVVAWGDDSVGQLGNGAAGSYSSTPVAVKDLRSVKAVAAGQAGAVAVGAGGTVTAWGDNSQGELGPNGPTGSYSDVPVAVPGLAKVWKVSAGSDFNLALLHSGYVMGWGSNSSGQLGQNTTNNTATPVQVEDLNGVEGLSAGAAFSVVKAKNLPPSLPAEGRASALEGVSFTHVFGTESHPRLSTFAESGALPAGLTFTDNHDNSATLSGTPATGTANTYQFSVSATNGLGNPAVETFELTVGQPAITSSSHTTKKRRS